MTPEQEYDPTVAKENYLSTGINLEQDSTRCLTLFVKLLQHLSADYRHTFMTFYYESETFLRCFIVVTVLMINGQNLLAANVNGWLKALPNK